MLVLKSLIAVYILLCVVLLWSLAHFAKFVLRRLGRTREVIRKCKSVLFSFGLGYLCLLIVLFAWSRPWREDAHLANLAALDAQERAKEDRHFDHSWISERLISRLSNRDTLVAISISGGGSRSAYFAASALEQLSRFRMPGIQGPGSSLVSNIDLLSTVSGGSVAGAYFTAHVPLPKDATDAALRDFFVRFKRDMSTDFESDVVGKLVNPFHTLSLIGGYELGAEALGESFDRRLFGGQHIKYAELLKRESEGAPILVINATVLSEMSPFTFTRDTVLRPVFLPMDRPISGRSTTQLGTSNSSNWELEPFGWMHGDLREFPVSAAVAASSAYPALFGAIRLRNSVNMSEPITYLADGGLVDNSGLISLYAHIFTRELFAARRINRIIVIAIDASYQEERYRGALGAVFGVYDVGQEHLQSFVLPEMLRRISHEELADILDKEEWKGFQIPTPLVLSYSACSSYPRVATSFRLSNSEMQAIEAAAQSCGEGSQPLISWAVAGTNHGPTPVYEGVIGPKDRDAWSTALRLALAERNWHQLYGRFATIKEVRTGRMMSMPMDYGQHYASLLKDIEQSGFELNTVASQSGLLIFVRPREYKNPGRVSFVIDLDESVLRQSSFAACLGMHTHVFGKDHGGGPADLKDPPYLPYGLRPEKMCL